MFKVLTSIEIYGDDEYSSALGVHYETQLSALNVALEYLETMVFTGNKKKFTTGGIITIKGTIALHEHLRDHYNVPYLKTVKLNQCHLERYFGSLREMGTDRHPSALHLIYRLQRKVIELLLDVS